MNKLFLIGNLTKDPEISQTQNGLTICKFTIAVNRQYQTNGEKITDFFSITVWRTLADNCGKYLKKGSKVAVTAQLQNHSYEDRDGNKRSRNDIIAEAVEFLSSVKNDAQDRQEPPVLEEIDEDLPF